MAQTILDNNKDKQLSEVYSKSSLQLREGFEYEKGDVSDEASATFMQDQSDFKKNELGQMQQAT